MSPDVFIEVTRTGQGLCVRITGTESTYYCITFGLTDMDTSARCIDATPIARWYLYSKLLAVTPLIFEKYRRCYIWNTLVLKHQILLHITWSCLQSLIYTMYRQRADFAVCDIHDHVRSSFHVFCKELIEELCRSFIAMLLHVCECC